jgi:hypothetical protein
VQHISGVRADTRSYATPAVKLRSCRQGRVSSSRVVGKRILKHRSKPRSVRLTKNADCKFGCSPVLARQMNWSSRRRKSPTTGNAVPSSTLKSWGKRTAGKPVTNYSGSSPKKPPRDYVTRANVGLFRKRSTWSLSKDCSQIMCKANTGLPLGQTLPGPLEFASGAHLPSRGRGAAHKLWPDNTLTPRGVLVESASRAKRGAGDALYLRSPSRA